MPIFKLGPQPGPFLAVGKNRAVFTANCPVCNSTTDKRLGTSVVAGISASGKVKVHMHKGGIKVSQLVLLGSGQATVEAERLPSSGRPYIDIYHSSNGGNSWTKQNTSPITQP
ncbi:MAG: hypothetical protein ACYDH5_06075 [Acidimicrobiales bacterium]